MGLDLHDLEWFLADTNINYNKHKLRYYPAEEGLPEQQPGWSVSWDCTNNPGHYIEFEFDVDGTYRDFFIGVDAT